MQIRVLITLAFFTATNAFAQNGIWLDWARAVKMGPPGAQAVAPDGSLWVAGDYVNPYIDFHPHPDTQLFFPENLSATRQAYLLHYDSLGNPPEVLTWEGKGDDQLHLVGVDGLGGIMVLGETDDSLDISLNNSPAWIAPTQPSWFLARFGSDRSLLWVHVFEKSSLLPLQLLAGEDGSVYLAGSFTGSADLNAGIGTQIVQAGAAGSLFFARYQLNGSLAWAHAIGIPAGIARIQAISVRDSGFAAGGYFIPSIAQPVSVSLGDSSISLTQNGKHHPFLALIGPQGTIDRFSMPAAGPGYSVEGLRHDTQGNLVIAVTNQLAGTHQLESWSPSQQLLWRHQLNANGNRKPGQLARGSGNLLCLMGEWSSWITADSTYQSSQFATNTNIHLTWLDQNGVPQAVKSGERIQQLTDGFGHLYFSGGFTGITTLDNLTPPYELKGLTISDQLQMFGRFVNHCQAASWVELPVDTFRTCNISLELDARVTGTGLRFQWREGGLDMTDLLAGTTGVTVSVSGSKTPWLRTETQINNPWSGFSRGEYHLEVYDACGSGLLSPPSYREIFGSPYLPGAIDLIDKQAGDTLVMKPFIDDYPEEVLEFQWLKGNFALYDGGRFSGTQEKELRIYPVLPSDQGTYHCVPYTSICPEGAFFDEYSFSVTVEGTYTSLDPSALSGIHLFPNPAREQLTIESEQPWQGNWRLSSVQGQTLAEGKVSGDLTVDIFLPELSGGLYLLHCQTKEGKRSTTKLLIQQP